MTDEHPVPDGTRVIVSVTTEPADEEPTGRDWWSLLKHPLLITGLTLLLTTLLVSPIARHWQDRQKEVELKRDLVEQVATTSTTAVRQGIALVKGDIQSAGAAEGSTPAEAYLVVRNAWLINRASARSAIVTYFPDLESCWYSYERAVADYLGLVAKELGTRRARVNALQSYVDSKMARTYDGPDLEVGCEALSTLPPRVQARYSELVTLMANKNYWDALIAEPEDAADPASEHTKDSTFRAAYEALGEAMLIGKDRINKSIVSYDSEVFDTGWFDD